MVQFLFAHSVEALESGRIVAAGWLVFRGEICEEDIEVRQSQLRPAIFTRQDLRGISWVGRCYIPAVAASREQNWADSITSWCQQRSVSTELRGTEPLMCLHQRRREYYGTSEVISDGQIQIMIWFKSWLNHWWWFDLSTKDLIWIMWFYFILFYVIWFDDLNKLQLIVIWAKE